MDPKPNPGYAFGQLARALVTSQTHTDPAVRARAEERARRWTGIFEGLVRGGLDVGSRAPVPGTPPWVTLRVEKGGFATGERLAEGPLRAHELDRLRALGLPVNDRARAALNASYLTDAGVEELRQMLREGTYRLDVPEEGVLLAVVWLLDHGKEEIAREILDLLGPWFPRLRFYPVPYPTSPASNEVFRLQDVGETLRQLDAVVERPMRPKQRMCLRRAPIYDRLVALLLEEDRGKDWMARACALLAEPVEPKKKSAFAKLLEQLKKIVRAPDSLTEGDRTFIRSVLEGFVRKRGAPGSERHRAFREKQARELGAPTMKELGTSVADRLRALPPDGGLDSLDGIPELLRRKVSRSLNAPLEELVARGVIPSGEILARLVPRITARAKSAGMSPELGRLYGELYESFRRRRSLLLLNYASQVKFEELPWVKVLEPEGGDRAGARAALQRVAGLQLGAWPHVIVPNMLLKELRTLSRAAGLELPWVDELAADIFMGGFTAKFLRAAKRAGRLLRGTLYERYYGIDYAALEQWPAPEEVEGKAPVAKAFSAHCAERAGGGGGGTVAANGKVIEQAQILTSHNLATLFDVLSAPPDVGDLARKTFAWLDRRLPRAPKDWRARLHHRKHCAYAWRQLLFYLSQLPAPPALVPKSAELAKLLEGLRVPGQVFLGWTTGT